MRMERTKNVHIQLDWLWEEKLRKKACENGGVNKQTELYATKKVCLLYRGSHDGERRSIYLFFSILPSILFHLPLTRWRAHKKLGARCQ